MSTPPSNPALPIEALPTEDFADRHVGPDASEITTMLAAVGRPSLESLIEATVPASIRDTAPLGLPSVPDETAALAAIRSIADRNQVVTSLIGTGYYGNHTPDVILRNILENPAWYTAYTPYQPEISQGRLEALLNFQTVVSDLTGMDIANASLLDEATAAAEAMMLARRQSKVGAETFFVDADCHPQVVEVTRTRAEPLGIKLVVGDPLTDLDAHECFGVLLAYPGSSGSVRDLRSLTDAARSRGAVVCVTADLLALTLLTPPGEWGADVVVGSAQRFGVPFGFGGPHAGFMAVRETSRRSLPGRLVGVSVDADGRRALRLALQTREQHIRREKATSNICTAQVLLAVMAASYATYHGPDGLRRIAERTHRLTQAAVRMLADAGVEVVDRSVFDTFTVRVPGRADELVAAVLERGINLRRTSADEVGFSFDETTTPEIVVDLLAGFGVETSQDDVVAAAAAVTPLAPIDASLHRSSDFLTHPMFHRYRSETEMLRYLRRLADKDLALDRSMIPLGSCTMKLNATAEMIPVTWPEFAQIHPFAPRRQAAGYLELVADLEGALATITGYDAVSLQPNAGSQGEFAGLLAIREYHRSRGDLDRDVCLIPASAHGTNAASAVMAGMRVVVVACDDDGNVDLDDLRAKADEHADAPGGGDGHLPVDPRRVRRGHQRAVRRDPRRRRTGVRRRRQPQRARRCGEAGRVRCRRQSPEPAQDVLHPPRRRRSGRRPGGRARAPGAVPAEPRAVVRGRSGLGPRRGVGRAVRLGRHPADHVDVHHDDGRRAASRDRGGDPHGQLRRHEAPPPLPGALHRSRRPRRPRVHHRPASDREADRHHHRRRRQAAHRLRVPRADHVVPGAGHAHDRADRVRGPGRARPVLRRDDRHPWRDRPGRRRHLAGRRQPARARAAHRGRGRR